MGGGGEEGGGGGGGGGEYSCRTSYRGVSMTSFDSLWIYSSFETVINFEHMFNHYVVARENECVVLTRSMSRRLYASD